MNGSAKASPSPVYFRLLNAVSNVVIYVLLLAFLVFTVVPFVTIAMAGFKTPVELVGGAFTLPKQWLFTNYVNAWKQAHFDWYFRNSVIVALPVVVISTVLSIMSGYAFALMKFDLSKVLFAIFLLGIMAPQEAYIIPLYYLLVDMGLNDTYFAMILPQIAMSVCFGTFWMRGFFAALPGDLVDAARVDGCNPWQVLWSVLVPNAWAAVSTMCVLFFIWTWNDFMIALVNVSSDALRTLPLGLAFFQGRHTANVPLVSAGATIVALPNIVVYLLFQRQFTRGVTSGTLHGQ
ncbi:MAG: carbohydrate ABC transporter permease [Anaerolineae bacterium]|nr:carbohydrate ABC transporter permease [Anaerolineae bacterium]